MSVHNVSWVATSSAVGNLEAIEAALSWLTGGDVPITKDKVRSYHGSRMVMLRAEITRKKAARTAVSPLGADLLATLAADQDLAERIDQANTLHLRLDLGELVRGNIALSDGSEEEVKGRIKLEVYPGQNALENARTLLSESAEQATRIA